MLKLRDAQPEKKEMSFTEKWDELLGQVDTVKFVQFMVAEAIKKRASDIHLEQRSDHLLVRIRVDGVLIRLNTIRAASADRIIACIKGMAQMRLDEHRLPQDGRIPIRLGEQDYDLRVSCLPASNGEEIVMRVLDKGAVPGDLSGLGLRKDIEDKLRLLANQPNGMIIFTGPTGSGKTTTQYAIINTIASPEKKILTVENPVEYKVEGLSQVQVNLKAGLTFDLALATFLRQDPDIIMVGEMRDIMTAKVAIEAALTGHLVLSTLHTNNAPSAIVRLAEMGVEPYLVPDTVIGVLAQRLARKICQHCKESYDAPADVLIPLGYKPVNQDEYVRLYRGTGVDPLTGEKCEHCYGGYRGRVGLYELMVMDGEIGHLMNIGATLSEVRRAALNSGMKTLQMDGLDKVLQGFTTPQEVERVVFTAGAEI